MLNRPLLLLLVVFCWAMASSHSSHAQLLQDRNKLKTARRASGFLQFIQKPKKSKGPSGKHQTIAPISPRYSKQASRESQRRINPRYSDRTAGQVSGRKINPRYSDRTAGQVSGRKVNPRFSDLTAGQVSGRKVNPRYSVVTAGQVRGRKVKPRYSVLPKYPRTKLPGDRSPGFFPYFKFYQQPVRIPPGPNSDYAGSIKRKVQRPFDAGAHNQNIKSYKKFTNRSLASSPNAHYANFELKTKKRHKRSSMYPSANYLSAKYNKSRLIRNVKRKFNVVWVRMHGNKTQPDAVKKKGKKAKFDKDEIDIWNN